MTNNTARDVGDEAELTGWRGSERTWGCSRRESVHRQANLASPSRDMPVESFYGWASDPHLRSVPGTEGSRRILSYTKSRTLTTVSKKPIWAVPFPPLEALRGVIPTDRDGPEYAFEPEPLLRENEGDDAGRHQAPAMLEPDRPPISLAPLPPWQRAPRTPRGRRPCPRAPNHPLPPQ